MFGRPGKLPEASGPQPQSVSQREAGHRRGGSWASQTVETQFSVSMDPGHICHSVAGWAWPNP